MLVVLLFNLCYTIVSIKVKRIYVNLRLHLKSSYAIILRHVKSSGIPAGLMLGNIKRVVLCRIAGMNT